MAEWEEQAKAQVSDRAGLQDQTEPAAPPVLAALAHHERADVQTSKSLQALDSLLGELSEHLAIVLGPEVPAERPPDGGSPDRGPEVAPAVAPLVERVQRLDPQAQDNTNHADALGRRVRALILRLEV